MILILVAISLFFHNCHGTPIDCHYEVSKLRKELQASVDSEWFVPFNGYKYKLTQPANWTEARSECQELGGDLATVGARDSYARRIIWLRLGKPIAWIGFNDLEREGEYTWIDGVLADRNLDWNDDEPDNAELLRIGVKQERVGFSFYDIVLGDEDCGNLYQGKLSDEYCADTFPGLCEKKVN
ncbi:unnamed protein product [Clavelina lepadiformis]|uniref:C-type lectin domain-containing protein n=1 Tax=Clavelina lepadiformis TaxID=159417 RepID=A0ABP0GI08_CLALP